jgi:hypothetical protein
MQKKKEVSVYLHFYTIPWFFLFFSLFLGTAANAQEQLPSPSLDVTNQSLTLFTGQGVDHDLPGLPKAIVRGDIRWDKSYYTGLAYARTRKTLGDSFESLQGNPLGALRHGYEIIFLQHHGLQDNAELGATYFLRTPNLELGPVRVNFGAGGGLSHAFGKPTYEDGPADNPQRRYRTQFSGFMELEWSVAALPQFSLALRVQHRSGIYGLIAPRRVGSNFLAAALRYKF